jgi:hypothetical protein
MAKKDEKPGAVKDDVLGQLTAGQKRQIQEGLDEASDGVNINGVWVSGDNLRRAARNSADPIRQSLANLLLNPPEGKQYADGHPAMEITHDKHGQEVTRVHDPVTGRWGIMTADENGNLKVTPDEKGSKAHADASVGDVQEGLRALNLYDGKRNNGREDEIWGRKTNDGVEKLIVYAQMKSGETISGAYTDQTRETLKAMANEGKISPKLVAALDRLNAEGKLDQLYGPHDVQAVAFNIRSTHMDLPAATTIASKKAAAAGPASNPVLKNGQYT